MKASLSRPAVTFTSLVSSVNEAGREETSHLCFQWKHPVQRLHGARVILDR